MKYNIIGDIHGRTEWIYLVQDDAINIFVGDYFSPYDKKITFEDCKHNFLDIIEYKKKHWDNTILLIGNHDEDHWHICEGYSRHDRIHEDEIRELFEMHRGLFQVAYAIDDKALVTHAGVSYVWYEHYKNHYLSYAAFNCNFDDPDKVKSAYPPYDMIPLANPIKFSLCKNPEEAYSVWMEKAHREFAPENKKPKDGQFIEWQNKLWKYNKEFEKFEEYYVSPQEVADFINKLWKEDEKYSAFSFDANRGYYDSYGNDEKHSPMWIRPEALAAANIFKFRNIWQFFGHTQQLVYLNDYDMSIDKLSKFIINDKSKFVYCDCLGYAPISIIYDSETNEITINKQNIK